MSPAASIDPKELSETLETMPKETTGTAQMDVAVEHELQRILDSPSFRTSSRCQEFLRHVVLHAEAPSELKERTIGVAVFGRASNYDTGNDAIVRVKAIEVRKRLSQYNQQAAPDRSVIIELYSGSYQPRIVRRKSRPETKKSAGALVAALIKDDTAEPAGISSKARSLRSWWMWAVALVALTAAAAAGLGIYQVIWGSASKKFLYPFVAKQPIICISNRNAYNLSLQNIKKKGDAPEAVRLKEMMQSAGRTTRLSVDLDITERDLADSPMIVLGGPQHNHWAAEVIQDQRFSFQAIDGKPAIVDRNNPSRNWQNADMSEDPTGDFALVTRLVAANGREQILSIAGIKALGTIGGVQIVFNPTDLEKILRSAPENWEHKNLQFVLHVQRQDRVVSDWDIRAATAW